MRRRLRTKLFPLLIALALLVAGILAAILWQPNVPVPYAKADYYSHAFVEEMARQPGGWFTPASTTLVLPNNFQGRWFNVQNGRRVTLGRPADAAHTLWLVGGSAVYDPHVPDAYTLASQLQNFLNKQTNNTWQVENLGAIGTYSGQETERLFLTPVKAGDIVVFYDGAAEIAEPLAADTTTALSQINKFIGAYGNALDAAARFTQRRGSRFLHVLQPTLFSQAELSADEQQLAADTNRVPAGLENNLRVAYPHLRLAMAQLAVRNGWIYADLSTVLDGPEEYYLGASTVNERANARVAGYLAQIISKMIATSN